MNGLETIASPMMWAGFVGFVLVMLALDLFVFGGNKAHKVSVKEAGIWSLVWVSMALLFNAGLWWYLKGSVGSEIADQKALEFFSGYLIEKALSVDNVFVFLLIFTAFQVPQQYQRRVLIYGVLGAIIMRAIMISAGAWVVSEFSWVLYLFGAFLLFTGIRMLVAVDAEPDVVNNPILKFARRHLKVSEGDHGEKFFVRINGVRFVTPLFLVLILIEVTDLVFAVDSIPAIFAITTDPFIVFTSNMFAILGLRALYFLLVDVADRFHLLKYGLAMVLTFIGVKMLIMPWYHVPVQASLTVVAVLIAGSCIASVFITKKDDK
ncbi:MAG: TerC family protein [Massilia sp.]|jgi:tellurite resistance protein TerC|uniref:Tellurite resistance protein TerC n=1 Tax=Massilia aurea TaxID=373040 RepID=A0A7W9U7S7_9BURK|nr:TerC family protein [Massilia aurea]MBB6132595.1 tellurite resistance protein TerC [Massilia aurea]RYE79948.1 MAG: TerC family protein [Oxalobacteraceae bacterium]